MTAFLVDRCVVWRRQTPFTGYPENYVRLPLMMHIDQYSYCGPSALIFKPVGEPELDIRVRVVRRSQRASARRVGRSER